MKSKDKRKRRPREIEMVTYGKRTWSISDVPKNGIDVIESEILGGFQITQESIHAEFLRLLREKRK